MSHMVSNISLGKCGDFRARRTTVHPSFLLAFNLLLLFDIYVYFVNGFMYYSVLTKINFTKWLTDLPKLLKITLKIQAQAINRKMSVILQIEL